MVKIKLAVIRSTRAKDGTYKIRISIGHKSETHYIVTPYSVPSLSNFKNGTIVGTPTAHHDNMKLRQLLTEYEDRLERIPNPSDYSPTELRDTLKRMTPANTHVTVLGIFDECIRRNQEEGRNVIIPGNARRLVAEYLGNDLPLAMMSPATVDGYGRFLTGKGYANSSINMAMSQLRKVVNVAIRDFGVKYETHPFQYYRPMPTHFRDKDISVDDMRRIYSYNGKFGMVRDVLLLSYYLGGINLADLMVIDFRKANGVLDYIRTKTARTSATRVQLSIIPEAKRIIDKYMDANTGRLRFRRGYDNARLFAIYINRAAKLMARDAGVTNYNNVVYYTARKSFVQHGFDLGIPLETLEYCIGHSTRGRTIYNYMRIMRRHADKAIRRIVDQLTGNSHADAT